MRRSVLFAGILTDVVVATGCDVNPFDQAQVPTVTAEVVAGSGPAFAWTPDGAAMVRVRFPPQVDWAR